MNPLEWDRRLVAPGPADRLTLLRVLLASVIGLRILLRRWWVIADRPDDLFAPVPVLAWLPGQPGAAVIVTIWLAGLAAVGLTVQRSLTGRSAGVSFLASWLCLLVLAGLWGSSGKILHNDLLLLTVCVPVLFAGSPARSDRGTADVRWGWPVRAALVVLGVVYLLTGYQKLRHSGLEWVFSSNMSWVIRQGRPRVGEDLARALADQLWLTQALAGGALLLELTAPVLLAVRRTRLVFAPAATVMHLSIWALLGLDYYGWVLAVWAVVLPSTALGDRLGRRFLAGSVAGMSSGTPHHRPGPRPPVATDGERPETVRS